MGLPPMGRAFSLVVQLSTVLESEMDFVSKRPTVVIADGSPSILAVLSTLLWHSFDIVAQAEDGEGAFQAITEFHPQFAILDISMRKISGFEVARRLRETQSTTKIVFLTLLLGEDFVREARSCGHGYVSKARVYTDLLPAVEAALRDEFFTGEGTTSG
jgi:DNA-binding NarL/FixJ family response regulator